MQTVSQHYLDGIKEGREYATKYGTDDARACLDTSIRVCRLFAPDTACGQFARGERDFWRNQVKRLGK